MKATRPEMGQEKRPKLRVLIIEDSEDDALLCLDELRGGGYDLTFERVETAEAMKGALERQTWDVVIADYSLPHFSALEALNLLKETDLDLPFIVISGTIGEDTAVEAMKAGAHDYMMKGKLKRLVTAIERELAQARVRRQRRQFAQELRDSEIKYRTLVEYMPQKIFLKDKDGKYISANENFVRDLKVKQEDIVGKVDYDFFPKELADKYRADDKRIMTTEKTEKIEEKFVQQGKEVWINTVKTPVRDDNGNVTGVLGIAWDITERKRAENLQHALFRISEAVNLTSNFKELLKVIHETLGTLIDTTNFYIALYDAEKDLYSFPYCVDQYDEADFTPKQLKGSLTDYVRRTAKPIIVNEQTHHMLANAGEVGLIGRPSPIWLGVPLQTRNGVIGVVVVQSYSDPEAYSETDLNIMSFASDHIAVAIERKRAAEALRESEEKFKAISSSAQDAIIVIDNNGNISFWNNAAGEIFGPSADEVYGRNFHEMFVPEKHRDRHQKAFNKFQNTGEGRAIGKTLELDAYRKDGTEFPVELSLSRVMLNEKWHAIGIVRDITERKQMELKRDIGRCSNVPPRG